MKPTILIATLAVVTLGETMTPRGAVAQEDPRPIIPYAPTLTFGTGLVTIPVAWASPTTGDIVVSGSARAIGEGTADFRAKGSLWDLTQSVELHAGGRVTLGFSLYGTEQQQVGFSGQFVVLKQPRHGPRWLPAVAIGARNLGSTAYQDRFVTGLRRAADVLGDSARGRGAVNGNPTLYGVATRDFSFMAGSASLSVGYGNGLFRETGALGSIYNGSGTIAEGLFFGFRLATPESDNGRASFVLENNGFDWNSGVTFSFGHLSFGVFLTEIEERKGLSDDGALANFTKSALLLSYSTSVSDIVRGSTRRVEAAEAALALRRLSQEIEQRRVITARLVAELNRASAAASASTARDQEALIRQLNAEREALKDAQKRLEDLQKRPPDPGSPR